MNIWLKAEMSRKNESFQALLTVKTRERPSNSAELGLESDWPVLST